MLTKKDQRLRVHTTGSEKRHLMVVVAVSAAGSVLTPMIIFKGKHQLKDICPRSCVGCGTAQDIAAATAIINKLLIE